MKLNNKPNIFSKVVILVFALLIFIMFFFTIYSRITVRVIETEIESSNTNKLMFLKSQLEEKFNQISMNSIALANDPAIKELEYQQQKGDPFDRQRLQRMILDHILLQTGTTSWRTDISVYFRLMHEVIATSSKILDFEDKELISKIQRGWHYQETDSDHSGHFVWYSLTPTTAIENPESARLVVKTEFNAIYLQNTLDQYKSNGQSDPLLYNPQFGIIGNKTLNLAFAEDVEHYLRSIEITEEQVNQPVQLSNEQYLLSVIPIYGLDWYLVDSIPVDKILTPVTSARNFFYLFAITLLCGGIVVSYILYRQLQVPIRELIKKMQGIKRGNYASRIPIEGSGEFHFLFQRFNEMAQEIQMLLETVYEERIRSREASLKQLQSQINPHFLYNCLFFLKNKARLGDEEAVVAMALNLGEYFRYTTRLGKQTAELREELDVLKNYLEIQNLRTNRYTYRIDVPTSILTEEIPRLILQPVVENAIIHGIEPKDGRGNISISGQLVDNGFCIVIEDDGIGMDDLQIAKLNERLDWAENQDNVSFGLWNVNQRLKLMFNETSGLRLSRIASGGTSVTLLFRMKGDEVLVSNFNR